MGTKATPTVQLAFGESWPEPTGQVVFDGTSVNSAASFPVMAMGVDILRTSLPALAIVTVLGKLVDPIAWLPKARFGGDIVAAEARAAASPRS